MILQGRAPINQVVRRASDVISQTIQQHDTLAHICYVRFQRRLPLLAILGFRDYLPILK